MQIVSNGDNLHKMSNSVFLEKYFNTSSAVNFNHSAKCLVILRRWRGDNEKLCAMEHQTVISQPASSRTRTGDLLNLHGQVDASAWKRLNTITFCLDFCLAAFFSCSKSDFFSFSNLFRSFSSSFFRLFASSFSLFCLSFSCFCLIFRSFSVIGWSSTASTCWSISSLPIGGRSSSSWCYK